MSLPFLSALINITKFYLSLKYLFIAILIFLFIFIDMKTKEKENKLLIIRVNKNLKNNYRIFCMNNEYNMSERIRQFMENDLKNNNK